MVCRGISDIFEITRRIGEGTIPLKKALQSIPKVTNEEIMNKY